MHCIDISEGTFLSQFREFEGEPNIEIMINRALNYISPYSCFCGERKQFIIFLLAAHFLALQKNINDGETAGGIQSGASIDKVSVSLTPPPFSDNFEYFFSQTVYGQELLALFNLLISTPTYIGGSYQRVL